MTDLRKAAEMALKALIYHQEQTRPIHKTQEVITALRQALAQPEQDYKAQSESVQLSTNGRMRIDPVTGDVSIGTPSKPWVGLTEDESSDIYNAHHNTYGECITSAYELVLDIEAKLKEKNT